VCLVEVDLAVVFLRREVGGLAGVVVEAVEFRAVSNSGLEIRTNAPIWKKRRLRAYSRPSFTSHPASSIVER
jgi:hypothetical protein